MDKKIGIALAALVLFACLFALLQLNQPTGLATLEEPYAVRIGYKPNSNYIPLFVALEKGFFEEQGLKVETIRFDSTNTLMAAFAAGKLDATPTGNVVVSYSIENAQPGLFKTYIVVFYTGARHPESFVARKGSGIKSYKDLEGKKIGVNKGVFAKTLGRKFLEMKGVKNFEIIELADNLQLQALEKGSIDALLSLEPNPTIAIEKGIAEQIEDGSVYAKLTPFPPSFSAGVVSTKFLEEHPVEAKKFLRAMKKAVAFIANNFEQSKEILPKHIAIEPQIAKKITFEENYFFDELTEEQVDGVQKSADFLFDAKILTKRVAAKALLLDKDYLK